MYSSFSKRSVNYAELYLWSARISSTFLMVIWAAFFTVEMMRFGFDALIGNQYGQGAALAIVFSGYILGWRNEMAGGLIALLGTFALFAFVAFTMETPLAPELTWFAVPGILYLLASAFSDRRNKQSEL